MVVTTVQKGDHATDSVKAADHAQWNFVPPEVRAKIKPPRHHYFKFQFSKNGRVIILEPAGPARCSVTC